MLAEGVRQSSDARHGPPRRSNLTSRAARSRLVSLRKEHGRVRREPREPAAVELDAEPRPVGDRQVAMRIELKGPFEDAVDIGAPADELDQIRIGKGGLELQVGRDSERGIPAMT